MINFDLPLNRRGTNTWKWDGEGLGVDYPLGTADMDFRMPDEIRQAIHDKVDQGVLSYAADQDLFCKSICSLPESPLWFECPAGAGYAGTALMAIYKVIMDAFTAAGDGVIVQTPVFGPFYSVTKNNGRILYDNGLVYDRAEGTWSINFEELEEMASDPRVRLLVVCNPETRPTRGFTREEMQKMYDICKANTWLC